MYSQGILPSDSTESTAKKGIRATQILGFIEFIFISICLLLLLLNQYLNKVVDDYSPAYEIPDKDYYQNTKLGVKKVNYSTAVISQETTDQFYQMNNSTTKIPSTMQSQEEETQKVFLPTTLSLPTNPTTNTTIMSLTTDITETEGNDTAGVFNNHSNKNDSNLDNDEDEFEENNVKRSALNDLKTKIAGKHLKLDDTIMESAMESPQYHSKTEKNLKSKLKEGWTNLFVSNLSPISTAFKVKRGNNVEGKSHDIKTKLSNLLIMYPCCTSAMMILSMQMISRFTNDIMLKSTMIVLISTCIGLGITVFATSIIESLSQRNSITILIAVGSAIFIILEIIDFILLFRRT